MSAARLLRRMTGRGEPSASDDEIPMLTHRHAGDTRPVPRSVANWCLVLSLFLMAVMAGWLIVAGSSLVRTSGRLAEVNFRAPSFQLYLSTLPGKPAENIGESAPLTAAEIAGVSPLAAVERAFESIRQFENARAEFRLAKQKPVLSGVVPGSPAQQAGLQKGDELLSAWGKPVGFVWEFFVAMSANGAPSVEVDFKRGEVTYRTTVMLATGAALDLANTGVMFDIPEGVRYLAPGDSKRLAEDFIRGYIEAVPPEWRKAYAASLDGLMRGLTKRVDDQKARPPQDPAYLRSELMLTWHHEAFMAELERMRAQTTEATQAVAGSLSGLGRAAAALAFSLLLCLAALAATSRSSARHRGRRGRH